MLKKKVRIKAELNELLSSNGRVIYCENHRKLFKV